MKNFNDIQREMYGKIKNTEISHKGKKRNDYGDDEGEAGEDVNKLILKMK